MIDHIKYTVDGKTYRLLDNGDGTWSTELNAPSVAGNYSLLLEISQGGVVTYIDSDDPRYKFYLDVIVSAQRLVFLQRYVPGFISEIEELNEVYDIENIEFDKIQSEIEKIKADMFITTSSNDSITRIEDFMQIKGQGTLEQRKSYLVSLLQKGNKLSEPIIKDIANTIAGSDCIVMFFSANESGNPEPNYGVLRVQVLSPDMYKDYKYDDIARVLKPLVPSHIKLLVIKYFATWGDIKDNFASWNTIANMDDWQAVRTYIPPQYEV